MKHTILITVLMAICCLAQAIDPWPEPQILTNSMTLMAEVKINGIPAEAGDVLAAFITNDEGEQIRGKAEVASIDGIAGCLLQIYTEIDSEELSLRVWDESELLQYADNQLILSEPGGSIGSYPDSLYLVHGQEVIIYDDPWPEPLILPSSMSVSALVYINDIPATSDDILAAFVSVAGQEVLRGKVQIMVQNNMPGGLLQVFTESADEIIHFKVWDYSAQAILEADNTINADPQGWVGSYPESMYFINPGGSLQQIESVVFDPPEGNYHSDIQISLSCAVPDAVIHYTLEGQIPNQDSPVYTQPLTFASGENVLLKAKAWHDDWYPSLITEASYCIMDTVLIPYCTPPQGIYYMPVTVDISCDTESAEIYYTTDNSNPGEDDLLFEDSIYVDRNTIIKARAFLPGYTPSPIRTANYLLCLPSPTLNPPPGNYEEEINVELSCSFPNAVIRYTLDQSYPIETSELYTGPITISETTWLKAVAFAEGCEPSPVNGGIYSLPDSNGEEILIPVNPGIQSAYPNPFREQVKIDLALKSNDEYHIKIYNLKGECVYTSSGIGKDSFDLTWDGRDNKGRILPTGMYLLQFRATGVKSSRRIIKY